MLALPLASHASPAKPEVLLVRTFVPAVWMHDGGLRKRNDLPGFGRPCLRAALGSALGVLFHRLLGDGLDRLVGGFLFGSLVLVDRLDDRLDGLGRGFLFGSLV